MKKEELAEGMQLQERQKIEDPAKLLQDSLGGLNKYGGFQLVKGLIKGVENMDPRRKAVKNIFLSDSAYADSRKKLRKELEQWVALLEGEEKDPMQIIESCAAKRDKAEEMIAALRENGAFYVGSDEDAQKIRDSAFPEGRLNKRWPGVSVQGAAKLAGLDVPEDARVIVSCTKGYGKDEVLAKEKLFPVLAMFLYDTWEECMEIARANLAVEGMGHSVVIHSNNKDHIEAVPAVINVSRYAVNQVGGTALGGAMDNGLNPTTTLGCGTWGNNIISENLWFKHLMNVSRISYPVADMYIPTDEEIWESI